MVTVKQNYKNPSYSSASNAKLVDHVVGWGLYKTDVTKKTKSSNYTYPRGL